MTHFMYGSRVFATALRLADALALDEEPEDAYDAVVSQQTTPESRVAKGRRQAVAILTSLLSGERSWNDLSEADLAAMQGLPQIQVLIEAGRSLRHHDARAGLRFARLARYAADKLDPADFGTAAVADLRALAWAELSNAYRICDELPQASRAMDRAVYWARRGGRSDLLMARVADLLASLLCGQRRLREAMELMQSVHDCHLNAGRTHLAGRALISMGHYAASDGVPGKAIVLMRRGLALLDLERDPHLVAQTLVGMILYLADIGRHKTARRLLWRARHLTVESGNALDLLRLRWVEGRIHIGLDDFARAEAAFKEAREGFEARGQVYPAALAGLDLAALWARQGRVAEIHALTQEIIATFRALRIAREAIVTMLILQKACIAGGGQLLEIIEMVVSFLKDLEQQPSKRYESGSSVSASS